MARSGRFPGTEWTAVGGVGAKFGPRGKPGMARADPGRSSGHAEVLGLVRPTGTFGRGNPRLPSHVKRLHASVVADDARVVNRLR